MKYLLLIGVVILIYWYLTRQSAPEKNTDNDAVADELSPQSGNEAMVRCLHCGVFLPVTEAVCEGEAAYCSEQHRQLGKAPDS